MGLINLCLLFSKLKPVTLNNNQIYVHLLECRNKYDNFVSTGNKFANAVLYQLHQPRTVHVAQYWLHILKVSLHAAVHK